MSQDFTDDCFASGHAAQTDMQNIEDNFAALKSTFSGSSAPSNTVAGMWWYDTSANILKLRDEANSAWQSVWDFANNKPVIANLSNEITGAMIAAAIKDAAAGTASLRTLGTGAAQAAAGNDSRFTLTSSVGQGELKTAANSGNLFTTGISIVSLTGDRYNFPCQEYAQNGGNANEGCGIFHGGADIYDDGTNMFWIIKKNMVWPNYGTRLTLFNSHGTYYDIYYRNYYVTASDLHHWIFILMRNGKIFTTWEAPNHPIYGNRAIKHPFGSYNPSTDEIVVINPSLDDVERVMARTIPSEDGGYMTRLKSRNGVREDYERQERPFMEVFLDTFEIEQSKQASWMEEPISVDLPKVHNGKVVTDWRFFPRVDARGNPIKVTPIRRVLRKPDFITPLKYRRKYS